jgi:hypothetical protein
MEHSEANTAHNGMTLYPVATLSWGVPKDKVLEEELVERIAQSELMCPDRLLGQNDIRMLCFKGPHWRRRFHPSSSRRKGSNTTDDCSGMREKAER